MLHLPDDRVRDLLPSPAEVVDLMRETLQALADGSASVAPKSQVAADGTGFANAMPAAWPERGLLGVKWVAIMKDNPALGLPIISGLMVLSDAQTGAVRCTMDAAELTALRTAAVTGASIALDDRRAVFLGTGVQARSHARVLAAIGRKRLTVWGRRPEALAELAEWASREVPGLHLETTTDRDAAVRGAGVVISGLPIGLHGSELDPSLACDDATYLPIDYASVAGAAVARGATVAADDPEQFEALRPDKLGEDYPRASTATGALLRDGRPAGRVVVQNLGSGLGDVMLADAVARAVGV